MKLHILHDWSKWSRPTQGYEAGKVQWASCLICGKARFRRLGYDNQIKLSDTNSALDEIDSTNEQG